VISQATVARPKHGVKHLTPQKYLSAQSLITQIGSTIVNHDPNAKISDLQDDENTVGYPVPGKLYGLILPYNSSLSLTVGLDSSTVDDANAQQQILGGFTTTAASMFTTNGFKPVVSDADNASLFKVKYFSNGSDDCQITSYTTVDIVCASDAEVDTAREEAAPLVQAYTADDTSISIESVNAPRIKTSRTTGYQTAQLPVYGQNGETIVYLYENQSTGWKAINSSWFNDPQQDGNVEPNCRDFESILEAQAAYIGYACYDSTSRVMSTIK
jgi:hypothetical protein